MTVPRLTPAEHFHLGDAGDFEALPQPTVYACRLPSSELLQRGADSSFEIWLRSIAGRGRRSPAPNERSPECSASLPKRLREGDQQPVRSALVKVNLYLII